MLSERELLQRVDEHFGPNVINGNLEFLEGVTMGIFVACLLAKLPDGSRKIRKEQACDQSTSRAITQIIRDLSQEVYGHNEGCTKSAATAELMNDIADFVYEEIKRTMGFAE